MSRRVCLVDFDGVILRNPNVSNTIKKRIVNYVGRVAQTKCPITSDRLNSYLYKTYGHTMIGLHKVFGEEKAGSLKDYNGYVYDGFQLDRTDYYECRKELTHWEKFVSTMKEHEIPVWIFSNAPKEWCSNFIGDRGDVNYVYDHIPYDVYNLKPNSVVYSKVDDMFSDQKIFFIDDKKDNFLMRGADNWVNILFCDQKNFTECSDLVCCS